MKLRRINLRMTVNGCGLDLRLITRIKLNGVKLPVFVKSIELGFV